MAFLCFWEISTAFICFFLIHFLCNNKMNDNFPKNWPLLGMLPAVIHNLHKFHDWSAEALERSNLTFVFKGPWFARMDMLLTVDPANICYIMSSNFSNFPKGLEFKKIFDVLGDGIFNADSDLWRNLRKSSHAIISDPKFKRFSFSTSISKVETGLVPLLDHVADKGMVVDLQDIFQRFTCDTTFKLVTGYDPGCLSLEFPEIEFAKALDDAEEAILYRHIKPKLIWELERWFGFGEEKKMRKAYSTLDRVLYKYVSMKREDTSGGNQPGEDEGAIDMLTRYMKLDRSNYPLLNPDDDKFLRDTILNFMLAGRDTTSVALTWFFWLLSKNTGVLTKLRQEIQTNLPRTAGTRKLFDMSDVNKLVYLHGALCEALRLYPPVPFQHKSPSKPDVLPSGHHVDPDTKVLFSLYAMGRMRSVWGDDALEFKPERWITEVGGIKHEPSYKFLSFNAGPRTCLGKEVALTQMKAVAVYMIQNYDVKVVEGNNVEPCLSVILHMKHGLKVRITKRCLA